MKARKGLKKGKKLGGTKLQRARTLRAARLERASPQLAKG